MYISYTPTNIIAKACRICHGTPDPESDISDYNLVKKVGFNFKHTSILEHAIITARFDKETELDTGRYIEWDNFSQTCDYVQTYKYSDEIAFVTNLRAVYEYGVEIIPTLYLDMIEGFEPNISSRKICWFENIESIDHHVFENDIVKEVWFYNNPTRTSTFLIDGISRGCLQELARHRVFSLSVRSSRYTLQELKSIQLTEETARNYIVYTGNEFVDNFSFKALENLRKLSILGIKNDLIKYAMPEAYKTKLVLTTGSEGLYNFLELRRAKSAHWEIRNLANEIADKLRSNVFLK
jgi:hypothetical protein